VCAACQQCQGQQIETQACEGTLNRVCTAVTGNITVSTSTIVLEAGLDRFKVAPVFSARASVSPFDVTSAVVVVYPEELKSMPYP
jgi:hypothetical protein